MKRQLSLVNWEFQVRLGWGDREREVRQPVQVNLRFTPEGDWLAHETDDLNDTWNYAELFESWDQHLKTHEFRLIEKLTQDLWTLANKWLQNARGTAQLSVLKMRLPMELVSGSAQIEWEGRIG